MVVAMAVASIPKAQGAEIVEQPCIAQVAQVGYDISLYWPFMIWLIINLLLVLFVLKMIWQAKVGDPERLSS